MQTDRILLRRWQESDAETLFKYASDPDVGPHAGWPPHKSVKESLEIIQTVLSADTMWAVVLKETNEIIGCVGYLTSENSNVTIDSNSAEVGYWIAKPYWNKGICTEALKLVVDYCFEKKGYNSLWGTHFIDNPPSGKVMEKCGFLPTGEVIICPNLSVGADRPVRVLSLIK